MHLGLKVRSGSVTEWGNRSAEMGSLEALWNVTNEACRLSRPVGLL